MPVFIRQTGTPVSLPPPVCPLNLIFKWVGERTEEKIQLEMEGEAGEEFWVAIIPHFKSLRVLVVRIPGTAQLKPEKEVLDEMFPLLKSRTRPSDRSGQWEGLYLSIISRLATHALSYKPLIWLGNQTNNNVSHRFPSLLDDDTDCLLAPMPLSATRTPTYATSLRAHHAKSTISISHASVLADPAYSNTES
ncbi:uncharacterized protein ARMOST_18792 [Armillaria ostoyae]|uniref:Uncharacterized protein n=1 Tax=Armillaria ostoyae TaxID=47428 RepID=A0A284S2T5_ARMOS|nr:uncharacterized protein ARMOST_18792 [Armillaria ostoyae]